MWTGVISPIYFPSPSSACWLWILAVFPACVRRRTQDVVLHLLLQIPQCWLPMTEADPPTGLPQKCTKKGRQMGKAGGARGQLEGKAARGSSSVLTWGKLWASPSSSERFLPWEAWVPLRCLEHGVLVWLFFPELPVLACVSMPSCQNSLKETAAGELRNVSQNLGLVWGLEDFYRKLKRFLGQCLLRVFPLLLLTFSIFFSFHFCLSS